MFKNDKLSVFQFHKGTIKASAIESHNDIVTTFNSIKVQLRLKITLRQIGPRYFQFHKGTIKAR